MAAETLAFQNSTAAKKSCESDRRRRRRKQKKNNNKASNVKENTTDSQQHVVVEQVEIEYVPEKVDLGLDEEEFRKIFEKFSFKLLKEDNDKKDDEEAENSDSDSEEEEEKEKGSVSNKKKKRMKIAELKQVSSNPDIVEVWDATATEPKLLVFLKSYRNTVPVPKHWCQKRKYLQGKRGIQKQPFQLPDFIAATGFENIRSVEDNKKLKQKQREQRMQPKKIGMQLESDLLHDLFFKYQTKPKHLSSLGDLYYEGKEFEVKLRRELKPGGVLSRELKEALGMSEEGALPPPWLINMQRYGPPPSYPHLKIPGLNAPIPLGASFGYHPGGCGNPPYWWGNFEEKEDEKMEEEEEHEAGIQSVVDSLSSTPTGVETPDVIDVIDLRKQPKRKEPERRPLYQVLEEKEEKLGPATLLGTNHTYVVGTGTQDKAGGSKRVDLLKGQKSHKVDVTLQPEELDVMENVLSAKYVEAREEETLRSQREDFSHMVAENEKRKRKMQEKEGKSKKKDFKF